MLCSVITVLKDVLEKLTIYVVLEKTKTNISRNNVLNIVLKLIDYSYLFSVYH